MSTQRKPNPLITCACGCGKRFSLYDRARRRRRFISGHNMKLEHRELTP